MRPPLLLASVLIAGSSLLALADESTTRTGAAAYGDWRSDAPGVRRQITPADLPPPYATRSVAMPRASARARRGRCRRRRRASPSASSPPASTAARQSRVAPNGDIFVAESGAGRVTVLRAADGAAKAAQRRVFAAGPRPRPSASPSIPPGPDPHYVYVADTAASCASPTAAAT